MRYKYYDEVMDKKIIFLIPDELDKKLRSNLEKYNNKHKIKWSLGDYLRNLIDQDNVDLK